jgi:hypothetical protein
MGGVKSEWAAPMLMGQGHYTWPVDDNLPQLLGCAQSDTEILESNQSPMGRGCRSP